MFFGKFASKLVSASAPVQTSAQIQQIQKAGKEMLTSQLNDLSKFAQELPSVQANNEAIMKSLEKLAQAAKSQLK